MSNAAEFVEIERLLSVSEIFGPTLQGEGASQGMPAMFLRLGLCNLDCSWCDTPYTWDWQGKNGYAYSKAIEVKRMSVDAVRSRITEAMPPNLVVISGGEPMLQQRHLLHLANMLIADGYRIEIETNGTIMPDERWYNYCDAFDVQFNVSPKLFSSGVDWDKAIKPTVLRTYAFIGSSFKFVIGTPQCMSQVLDIVEQVHIEPSDVWLMPEGRSAGEVLEKLPTLFDDCVLHGFNLTPRLQVLTYGSQRGV